MSSIKATKTKQKPPPPKKGSEQSLRRLQNQFTTVAVEFVPHPRPKPTGPLPIPTPKPRLIPTPLPTPIPTPGSRPVVPTSSFFPPSISPPRSDEPTEAPIPTFFDIGYVPDSTAMEQDLENLRNRPVEMTRDGFAADEGLRSRVHMMLFNKLSRQLNLMSAHLTDVTRVVGTLVSIQTEIATRPNTAAQETFTVQLQNMIGALEERQGDIQSKINLVFEELDSIRKITMTAEEKSKVQKFETWIPMLEYQRTQMEVFVLETQKQYRTGMKTNARVRNLVDRLDVLQRRQQKQVKINLYFSRRAETLQDNTIALSEKMIEMNRLLQVLSRELSEMREMPQQVTNLKATVEAFRLEILQKVSKIDVLANETMIQDLNRKTAALEQRADGVDQRLASLTKGTTTGGTTATAGTTGTTKEPRVSRTEIREIVREELLELGVVTKRQMQDSIEEIRQEVRVTIEAQMKQMKDRINAELAILSENMNTMETKMISEIVKGTNASVVAGPEGTEGSAAEGAEAVQRYTNAAFRTARRVLESIRICAVVEGGGRRVSNLFKFFSRLPGPVQLTLVFFIFGMVNQFYDPMVNANYQTWIVGSVFLFFGVAARVFLTWLVSYMSRILFFIPAPATKAVGWLMIWPAWYFFLADMTTNLTGTAVLTILPDINLEAEQLRRFYPNHEYIPYVLPELFYQTMGKIANLIDRQALRSLYELIESSDPGTDLMLRDPPPVVGLGNLHAIDQRVLQDVRADGYELARAALLILKNPGSVFKTLVVNTAIETYEKEMKILNEKLEAYQVYVAKKVESIEKGVESVVMSIIRAVSSIGNMDPRRIIQILETTLPKILGLLAEKVKPHLLALKDRGGRILQDLTKIRKQVDEARTGALEETQKAIETTAMPPDLEAADTLLEKFVKVVPDPVDTNT
ncbi:hypothetical protein HK102_001470, partial [Quaeritorhiza haematococci]